MFWVQVEYSLHGKHNEKIDAFEPFEKSSLNLADTVIGGTVIHKSQTVWFVEGVTTFAAWAVC